MKAAAITQPITLRELPQVTHGKEITRLIESEAMVLEAGTLTWIRPMPVAIDYWVELTQGDYSLWLGFIHDPVTKDFDWRCYEKEVQDLAWCAAHDPIVTAFNTALLSDWTLQYIHDASCAPPADFSVGFEFKGELDLHCVGRAHFAPELLNKIRTIPARSNNPLGVDLTLPLTIDATTVSGAELKKLQVGSFIGMQSDALSRAHSERWRLKEQANGELVFTPERECGTQ